VFHFVTPRLLKFFVFPLGLLPQNCPTNRANTFLHFCGMGADQAYALIVYQRDGFGRQQTCCHLNR